MSGSVDLQKQDLLTYVLRVSRRMVEIRELSPLLTYAIDEALKLTGGEQGYIVLVTPEGALDFQVMRTHEGQDLTGADDKVSRSILSKVTSTGDSLIVNDAMFDPNFAAAKSVMHLRLRSILCVPLISHEQTIGAIYVENRALGHYFRDEDLAPLEIFANQAAVAIENAQLNQVLEDAHENLRRLDEMKSNFILLVSHELRTPLTSIRGYTDIVKRKAAQSEELHRYTERLDESVDRMGKTVQDIISVFRLTSDQIELQLSPVSLDQLVRQTLNEFKEVCQQRRLDMRVSNMDTLPLLTADGSQLRVVFRNIISNAIKYTPDGRYIEINGRLQSQNVIVTIHDTGIGIPLEEQERIFDLFHVLGRLENHSSSKHAFGGGGMGLGLPIAKGVIEAHGGQITISSPGHDRQALPGTTCTITLPLQDPTYPQ